MAQPSNVTRLFEAVNAESLYTVFTQGRMEKVASEEMARNNAEGVAWAVYQGTVFGVMSDRLGSRLQSLLGELLTDEEVEKLIAAARLEPVQKLLGLLPTLQEVMISEIYDSGLLNPDNLSAELKKFMG